ncbi:Bcr/CflA family multidrug efflux MFS transporter [Cupriavidus necator]|uniref:Bcr/CflA family efflux transporter n=1 Tax=Cupriavidus necator (strain ATCC 17699 / DSM 428 / KCTC 22496 / NCIMB 10442 / H16 / Stanier 337) TaxID=381666 RepID=Q0K1V2_CUPNH|nr:MULTISPECIES: Bcr/CflA family multidrug efflux MFS transporter [Cupriavidus]EON16732.1 major facilitator superfamily transporter DHA1 family protein [Cupriavidus sp. GA3-3]KUE89268.1 MFS transporter [Cupriavidus necator]QCC03894.1 Bcr/CflA family multidrug efflux MFS transporter [Cupriavidus necator H16]QQB80950.1 Bcr/CflA family multidrug efflux MFS transporter [Cupriavidus necator]WKA45254.1 Bcr/CflA family multidrug efflux MFS transporter [Cupriavidus necator]
MLRSTSAASAARFPAWLLICGSLMAIAPLSIDMYLPSFPSLAGDLGVDIGQVQLTLGTFLVGLALGQAFYGPFSDRFGRKPPLYVGLCLYVAAAVGCALARSVESLMLWRFLQALGGCAGMVMARAVIRDRLEAHESARAFSSLMLVMGVAPILAPIVGGAILSVSGWRAIFWVLAVAGMLILLLVHLRMEESLDRRHAAPLRLGTVAKSYAELLRDREFLGYSLSAGFGSAGMFAYISGSPFVLIELHGIAPSHYGFVFGANALGLITMSQLNARLVRGRSLDQVLGGALLAACAAGLALAVAALAGVAVLPVLLAGFFVFIGALGCVSPNASALALAHQGHRAGTASALMGTLQFSLGTLGGAAVSLWRDGTALPLGVVMAACGAGAVLMRYYGRSGPR